MTPKSAIYAGVGGSHHADAPGPFQTGGEDGPGRLDDAES